MEVLLVRPRIKKTIWGGRRLIEEFGYRTKLENAAEAWLLACHKSGNCIVRNRKYLNQTLWHAIEAEGMQVLGTHNAGRTDFPILIKLIDAKDKLSVQVHPGDEYARRVENENGKTEAWYVLAADPGAELVYGVKKPVTREAFSQSIEDGTLMETLNYVKVKAGDVVFIPSGMLHAIGAGILLAEVQQSSNTTYRVYDYDRVDDEGKKRELHVKKATDVVDLRVPEADFAPKGTPEKKAGGEATLLTACPYFSMTRLCVDGDYADHADETSFVSLLVLEGAGRIVCGAQEIALKKGDSVFVPANKGDFTLSGKMTVLQTRT